MLSKWAHLGHELGECWVNDSNNITYINIPKNASSFIKACLMGSKNSWVFSHSFVDSNELLIALRDPIDRWLSGMAQYQFNSQEYAISDEDIFANVTFDDHTELQTYFLQNIDLSKATFLRVDENLRATIKKWANSRGLRADIDSVHTYNSSAEDHRADIKFKYTKILENSPAFLLKLKEHFAEDYRLISKVKFYD